MHVLDLPVAQQLEHSVQDLYEFEWAGGAADGPGAPPEHALSGASAPACASCARVRQRAEGGGPRRNPCPHHRSHRLFFTVRSCTLHVRTAHALAGRFRESMCAISLCVHSAAG